MNEDTVGFWQPEDEEERQMRGSISIVADGVGGHGKGDVASKMAVDIAIQKFRAAPISQAPKQLLKEIFETANLELYDSGENDSKKMRMATTLSICIFRNKTLSIGHVGDTRTYLVRGETIKQLTADHSYTGMQVKLRLITEHEARASTMRTMLTRSVGNEPIVNCDIKEIKLMKHDRITQCTDGVYCFMNDGELCEGVDRLNMDEICPYLIALAERRGTDDNLSVQVVQVDQIEEPKFYKPLSILQKTPSHSNTVTHEIQAGQILDNRFEIGEVISRSGMASIFKAKDMKTGETVAIKIPHMQFEADVGFFSRFQREAEIGKKLHHPNILRFIDVPDQSRPYIVMEYIEGRSLADMMNDIRPFPVADSVQIASRICDALGHMHENKVVHRDLKPQNVMICKDGSLRIIDFGIAKSMEARRLTFAGLTTTMGTPDYMAPEQVKGRRGDARTDIYALGAMLYEMTTGHVPFEGPNPFIVMNSRLTGDPLAPRKRNPEIPPEVEEITLHAMEREPQDRYQSAAEMKAELDDPSSVKLIGRHHHLTLPKLWKTQMHGYRMQVLCVIGTLLVFLVFWLLTRGHHH
ncbi:MAG TPA: protein kinase [Chthoniobacteraceae bacterium]|nr:protein kinase [Chthoniobacteraceae bacterium]